MAVLELDSTKARRLFLSSVGLAADRDRPATLDAVHALVRELGYVQVDSIHVVERAHHLTLFSRLAGYKRSQLVFLLEKRRALFEHWTHDASVLPVEYFPFYRRRFERDRARIRAQKWWLERITGGGKRDVDGLLRDVVARFEREGPLGVSDFRTEEPRGTSGGFWGWTPEKAALEYLWRAGELSVAHRTRFQKVYDLTRRVLGDAATAETPSEDAQHAWAFGEALRRIGIGTPRELAAFFQDADRHAAASWVARERARGGVVEADVVSDEGRRRVVVTPQIDDVLARAEVRGGIRLLSPFDPLLRDRARVRALFGVDFRFEGFVPKADRVHGYYVMAALEGDRIVAKIDPKLDRERGVLVVKNVWWTKGDEGAPTRERALEAATEELARWLGATRVEWPPRRARRSLTSSRA